MMTKRFKAIASAALVIFLAPGCSGGQGVKVEGPVTAEEQAALERMKQMEQMRDQATMSMVRQMQQQQSAPASPQAESGR